MKTLTVCAVVAAGALLAACGEPDQKLEAGARKNATKVWQHHSGPSAYVAPGWKIGDESSWQQQIQDRTQHGQNEYNRTSATR
ncbi:hypothetical protein [Piscinibacter sakaiensis]|uniref:hypothetical protein n=1 Tax=Piscinibacter sakaiensis TaxID=1547922 RepID=UPI003AACF6E8